MVARAAAQLHAFKVFIVGGAHCCNYNAYYNAYKGGAKRNEQRAAKTLYH